MQVSRLTGGQVYKYTYFQADLDGERFIADLRHNVSRCALFFRFVKICAGFRIRIYFIQIRIQGCEN